MESSPSLLNQGLMPEKLIAYYSGLFDGEGSVYIDWKL